MKDAEHIDVEHPLERLRIDLSHRPVAGDAGVGHDDVDAAEAFDGLGGGRTAWRQIAHVGDRGQQLVVAGVRRPAGQFGFVEIASRRVSRPYCAAGGLLGPDSRAPPVTKTTCPEVIP